MASENVGQARATIALRTAGAGPNGSTIRILGDQAPPKRLTGIHVIPAPDCYYLGAVHSADMLEVDFDARDPSAGLYLVEEHGPHGVTWMGCRRFDRRPLSTGSGGLWMDSSGEKDWRPIDLDEVGWRVVGRVCRVYRAQYA